MASTPTTKSQVQAYQFVLRRMESALVRKDAVMLHDPMGSHKRATVVGVILACIGCIGFLVWGLFGGKGSVPDPGSIVIGKQSGSVYVVTTDAQAQKRLTPMLNMASAKLLVMAQGGGQNGQSPQPTTVNDAALADFPRSPVTGLINAPNYLPDPSNAAAPMWAVCDISSAQTSPSPYNGTMVIGGDVPVGTPMNPGQSLYVQDQTSGKSYLVYVPWQSKPSELGTPNPGVVKAEVDQNQPAILDMYGLGGVTPRPVSTSVRNAIPTAPMPMLTVPTVPGRGSIANYMHSANTYHVGDVVKETVSGSQYRYYLLLQNGKQQISEGAAAVLNAARPYSGDMPNATNAISNADDAHANERLSMLDSFPDAVPKPVGAGVAKSACLDWNATSGTAVYGVTLTNADNPAPKPAVKLAQADDARGPNVDYFYMPPGKAAIVRGTTNAAGANYGPLYLVSDQGVVYGIKDVATAQGLGVISGAGDIKPAPASILGRLPIGDYLDPAQASFQYDSVTAPTRGVNRPPQNQKQQAASGSGG